MSSRGFSANILSFVITPPIICPRFFAPLQGLDLVSRARIARLPVPLHFEHVYTTLHWLVRVYRVRSLAEVWRTLLLCIVFCFVLHLILSVFFCFFLFVHTTPHHTTQAERFAELHASAASASADDALAAELLDGTEDDDDDDDLAHLSREDREALLRERAIEKKRAFREDFEAQAFDLL